MSSRTIKSMTQLMSTHRSKCSIRQVLRNVWRVENGFLHYAGGKNDFVAWRIVVRVYGVGGHAPFGAVGWIAESPECVGCVEDGDGEGVGEVGGVFDVNGGVVVIEVAGVADVRGGYWVADFLVDGVD